MADKGLTYAEAGVDIDAGNRMVELIKPLVRATARPGADAEIGGFGGLFDLKRAGFTDPVLVAATDGVGTKVKIAIDTGLRREEQFSLRRTQVDLDRGIVTTTTKTKSGRPRSVPLPERSRSMLPPFPPDVDDYVLVNPKTNE